MKKIYLLVAVGFLTFGSVIAQETENKEVQKTKTNIKPEKVETEDTFQKIINNGIKIKLNEKGSSWSKVIIGMQFWYRNAQLNPGTVSAQTGETIDNFQDFAARRVRFISITNFEDKFYAFADIGLTGSYGCGSPATNVLIHDLWGKLRIAKNNYVGAGLHMWSGLSRYTMQSGLNQMTLDIPVTNFPNVGVRNQYNRQWGVFAQGRVLNGLNYSIAINQVMMPAVSKFLKTDAEIMELGKIDVAYNRRLAQGFAYKGYASYSFFAKESLLHSFTTATYLGKKGKILNVGAGFNITPNAAGTANVSGTDTIINISAQSIYAVDLFFETPMAGGALNMYGVYYLAYFGNNYLKPVAVMGDFASSGGIKEYNFGTGDMAYFSIGYFLKKAKLQPFYAATYRDFDGLNESSLDHDLGINYFISGQKIKLSAQYSTRSIYNTDTASDNYKKNIDKKGQFILQFQFKI